MPTLLDRFLSVFRSDAPPPQLPAAIERRADSSSTTNPFTGLGGAGDKGAVARPNPFVRPLTLQELDALWEYNGIARRIVEVIPSRACRRGWSVPEIGGEDARLQTWSHIEQAMSMGRLHGGSVLLMVTEDDVPSEFARDPYAWLQQPLDMQRVGAVQALQVFDAWGASPLTWERDIRSPDFRRPALWRLSDGGFSAVVHASRVVYFPGNLRAPSGIRTGWTSRMPDSSALQVVWDEVRRLSETLQGGAILAAEIREGVLKLGELGELMTGDEAGLIEARLQLINRSRGLTGYTVLGPKDEYENRSNPPTGFDQLSASAWEALAAVTGIPQMVLMGSAPAGLNTDGEASWEGFRQLVSAYQEHHRHRLERLYAVLYAAQDGPTRGQAPEGWALTFSALDEPDEASMAATRKIVMETDQGYVAMGAYTAATVATKRFGPDGYSFELGEVEPPAPVATDAKPYQDVGLPALITAAVIGPSGARKLLGVGEELAPTPAELAALALSQAGASVPAVNPATPRADADVPADSVVVLIPAADTGLRARIEAALGQALVPELDPHVTVLCLGEGLDAEAVAEVVEVVGREVAAMEPAALLEFPTLRTFAPGPDGTPVVVEYGDGYAVAALNERLLRALAHRVSTRQWPRYRPHLTVGHAPAPLTPEAQASLLGIDTLVDGGDDAAALSLRVPVSEVRVQVGGQVVATAYPGLGVRPPPVSDPTPTLVPVQGDPA